MKKSQRSRGELYTCRYKLSGEDNGGEGGSDFRGREGKVAFQGAVQYPSTVLHLFPTPTDKALPPALPSVLKLGHISTTSLFSHSKNLHHTSLVKVAALVVVVVMAAEVGWVVTQEAE